MGFFRPLIHIKKSIKKLIIGGHYENYQLKHIIKIISQKLEKFRLVIGYNIYNPTFRKLASAINARELKWGPYQNHWELRSISRLKKLEKLSIDNSVKAYPSGEII